MALSLRDALAIAKDYVNPKPPADTHYDVVVLRDGLLRATTGETGCEIPVDGIDGIKLAVDHGKLTSMLKAISGEVKLKAVKGRQLEIKGAGVRYNLKAIPASAEPSFPDIPTEGWREITKAQATAISAVASLVNVKNPNQALTGLRLTPQWCAGASRDAVAFAWIADLVEEPFTTPPGIFIGAEMDGDLVVDDGRLYIRPSDESIRWSLGYIVDWPDQSLNETVVAARGGARSAIRVDLADIGLMCRQATVVATDAREGFKLTIDDKRMTLEGTQGIGSFFGKIDVSKYKPGAKEEWVGVRADRLGIVCGVVEAANGKKSYLSVGGPLSPILVWNEGDVVIEALNMPRRLQGA